jgi:RNA polymerase sigma-70 factor (ECF subfamily)
LESDEALYQRVVAGDQQALAALVEHYYKPLLAFLIRLTGNVQTAEDLVQESFIRMLKYRGAAPSSFRPWAYRIVHNLALDYFRSVSSHLEVASDLDQESERSLLAEPQDTERLVIQADHRAQVVWLLQQLPALQREVLVLRFYHDLSLEEIAQITDVPIGTVKSRLFRGLLQARLLLEQEEVKENEQK